MIHRLCILLVFLLLATMATAQTLEKSQAIMIYNIVPTNAPCTFCSERAFVRADNNEYRWNGSAWIKWANGTAFSSALLQDSIIVNYSFGVEVGRDTVRVAAGGAGTLTSIVAGTNTTVDNTDPANPVINVPTLNDADASPTNEGALTVGAGGANDADIVSNTSGSAPIKLQGAGNTTITENVGTGVITISSTGGGGGTVSVDGTTITGNGSGGNPLAVGVIGAANIGTGAVGATQLASTAVTPGSYTYMSGTVDADGRFTAASSGTAPVTGSGTTNAIPKFTSSTAVGNSNITDDGTVVTLPKWRQSGAAAAFPQIGVSAAASIGVGAALIDTGVPWGATAIGRWEIEIGFSGSSSNGNEQIAGTVRFSVFTYSGTGAYFHVNAFGQSPKSDIGRLVKTPAGTMGVVWGEVTDGAATNNTPVYVTEVRSNFNNAAALANFSVSAITSLTGYTSIITCGSINKSVIVPLKLTRTQSGGANNVLQIGNSSGGADAEVGIFMSASSGVSNILPTDETSGGALTIAARRNEYAAPNLLFKWGGTIRAGFTANGFLSVGKTPIGATYPVEIGGNASIMLTPHDTDPIGAKGVSYFSDAKSVLLGHNGTSFGRYYMSSDVTPTNGQIPVFNSATGMNVYTTPTYGNGVYGGSGTVPSFTTAADALGASVGWNDGNLVLGGDLFFDDVTTGTPTRLLGVTATNKVVEYTRKDTLVIAIYCQGWNDAIATGTDYRGWRVPSQLNNARIIRIQYSADDINGGTVLVQTTNGVTNFGSATIPVGGDIETGTISQTITTGQRIRPDVNSITGSPFGLMMNLIIEK